MGKDTKAILKNTCACWTTSSLLGRWQLAKTFSSRQEFTWARAASPASQGLIMKIWLQWISNLVNQIHMPGSTWQRVKTPQDKCQRISCCGRFLRGVGIQNVPPGREGLRVLGMNKSREGTNRPMERRRQDTLPDSSSVSQLGILDSILLLPTLRTGQNLAPCFA